MKTNLSQNIFMGSLAFLGIAFLSLWLAMSQWAPSFFALKGGFKDMAKADLSEKVYRAAMGHDSTLNPLIQFPLYMRTQDKFDPADYVIEITEKELDLFVKTVWAEARGEGFNGMLAVAEVIVNRVKSERSWGNSLTEVVHQRKQFSCWNQRDPNRRKIERVSEKDKDYVLAKQACLQALKGTNVTQGANHYHTTRVRPRWAKGASLLTQIGKHKFYHV